MPFDFLCCVRPGVEDVMELDYSHQSLSEVPTEVFVYERTLETLLCQCNRITELPRQLFMCHGLKYLNLGDNDLQAIPPAISSLVNLQHFNVSRNSLASIPESMKALKYLMLLDLSVNPLEKLPDAVTNLIALQDLYLNDTYLEYLPGNFGRLANLRILELRDNYLMILPKSLSRSTELLRLDIGQNDFTQFPEVIGKFLKLKELWIDSNSFTDIPSVIKPLENLIHLEASNNMIADLAPEIGYCTQLVDLCLSSNSLTQLPDSIGQLSNLTTLKLDNNMLYSIPESMGQLTNLEELMLMGNYLERIPSSIGLLRKLQYLNIDDNMLRVMPPEIGSCVKLSVLSLRANKLTKVPPEIGHLSSLKVLNLVRNSLSCLPQSLLNCDNLVALWLSENQSKPLVPMHSEVDPHTYEQVLTCFLFPQVPLTPIEVKPENEKPEPAESQPSGRHISFVDMKAVPKAPEKPGQLRRAPTPYPKELRALAKHARNIHKDGAQDGTPMQNAVHIKAAKITPTLQQRFASDNKKDLGSSSKETADEHNNDPMKVSVYDNLPTENTYDKPLDLTYEPNKTYKSVDHALYPENDGDTNSETKNDGTEHYMGSQHHYNQKQHESYSTRNDIDRHSAPVPQSVYGNQNEHNYSHANDSSYRSSLDETRNCLQRLSLSSQDRHSNNETILAPHFQSSQYQTRAMMDKIPPLPLGLKKPMYPRNDQNMFCHAMPEGNYHDNAYESDASTYTSNKDKLYTQINCNAYSYHGAGNRDVPNSRLHTVSQVVSSTTMPNLSNYSNIYPGGTNLDGHHHSQIAQYASTNANIYGSIPSSPTYVSSQLPELYSPTGHTNTTNPYRMTNTPLISDDGSYSHVHSPTSQNMYDLYDAIPGSSNPPSVVSHSRHSPSGLSEPVYARGQPPPYHIAAPYTKHAQYFNGTGG